MSEAHSREQFASMYDTGAPPWDIGRPQPAVLKIADQVQGRVLDAGCGTGEHAILFAERGLDVTGIDFVPAVIDQARRKAKDRGAKANFVVQDALELADFPEQFDSVVDCGLFHVFSDEQRPRYVAGLGSVTRPGGKLFLLCFSDQEPAGAGPRRVTQQELRDAFVNGWTVQSIEPSHFDVRPDLPPDITFSPGGPKAWLAIFERKSIDS